MIIVSDITGKMNFPIQEEFPGKSDFFLNKKSLGNYSILGPQSDFWLATALPGTVTLNEKTIEVKDLLEG